MSTATENLIDAIIEGLQAALPDLADAQDITAPADEDYRYGEPELKPTVKVSIAVDASRLGQEDAYIGGGVERDHLLVVYLAVSGPDAQTVARLIHRWGDCLITALEGLSPAGATHLRVTEADYSPNLRGGNVLFRAVAIECEVKTHRALGDGP